MPTVPASPPKRMTRARARAVEETQQNKTKPRTIAIAISTTKAAEAPRAVSSITSKSRKRRADQEAEQQSSLEECNNDLEQVEPVSRKAPVKSTVRSTTASAAAKSRGPVKQEAATALKTRGRPRKNTITVAAQADRQDEPLASSGNTRNATTGKITAPKKKVTFHDDDSEKENVLQSAPLRRKTTSKAVATASRPKNTKVQTIKNPGAKATASKENPGAQEVQESRAKRIRAEPLSPKKATQVAKGISSSEDERDELGCCDMPTRELQKSPNKPTFLRELIGTSQAAPVFQDAALDTSFKCGAVLMSSPKRPPPSPFKDSMKCSPRKITAEMGGREEDQAGLEKQDMLSSKSPCKLQLRTLPSHASLEAVPDHKSKSASLLQSPSRRFQSPIKGMNSQQILSNTNHTSSLMSSLTKSSLGLTPAKRGLISSVKASAALRRSPEASIKVHKMTAAEREETMQAESSTYPLLSSPTISPSKQITPSRSSKIPIRSPAILPASADIPSNQISPLCIDTGRESRTQAHDIQITNARVKTIAFEPRIFDTDEESDDELQSSDVRYSPLKSMATDRCAQTTPLTKCKPSSTINDVAPEDTQLSMTALAQRFGDWRGATPRERPTARTARSMASSPVSLIESLAAEDASLCADANVSHFATNFEDALVILEDDDHDLAMLDVAEDLVDDTDPFRRSGVSEASQEYGDENAVPVDPVLLALINPNGATCTPIKVFNRNPQVIHTVSKVPLRPSADYEISQPTHRSRRGRSLDNALSPPSNLELQALRQINRPHHPAIPNLAEDDSDNVLNSSRFQEMLIDEDNISVLTEVQPDLQTPLRSSWSMEITPGRTPRADPNSGLLNGAVVFVDVHTSEGADASASSSSC